MSHILLVEDSSMLGRLAKAKIEKSLDLPVFWVKSMKEAEKLLEQSGGKFSTALLDYSLPDAPNGEIIDKVIAKGITSYVFIDTLTEKIREQVWEKKIADYIFKDDPNCLDYIVAGMRQLQKNRKSLVLIVDSSNSFRTLMSEFLYVRQYRVVNASDAKKGLNILKKHPEVRMVICGYDLPVMDGCIFCQKIRESRKNDTLAIIGVVSGEDRSIGARFIKSGADDYILKNPFLVEELYTRVDRCMKMLEYTGLVRQNTERDYLTGLVNRNQLFTAGEKLFMRKKEKKESLICILVDIDNLKRINERFGHRVGDLVIRAIGDILDQHAIESDIVAHFSGGEFCVLSSASGRSDQVEHFEKLRQGFEESPAVTLADDSTVYVTCSVGMCLSMPDSFDAMILQAGQRLADAKSGGGNCVEF